MKGRPLENEKSYCFDRLCEWVEQEAECYTIKELHQKMIEISNSEDVYIYTKMVKKENNRKIRQTCE